jgi:hypothetical protein
MKAGQYNKAIPEMQKRLLRGRRRVRKSPSYARIRQCSAGPARHNNATSRRRSYHSRACSARNGNLAFSTHSVAANHAPRWCRCRSARNDHRRWRRCCGAAGRRCHTGNGCRCPWREPRRRLPSNIISRGELSTNRNPWVKLTSHAAWRHCAARRRNKIAGSSRCGRGLRHNHLRCGSGSRGRRWGRFGDSSYHASQRENQYFQKNFHTKIYHRPKPKDCRTAPISRKEFTL